MMWLPIEASHATSRQIRGTKFMGSFAWLYKGLGIIHHYIAIGNSKANGQVECRIRILKDYNWHGPKKEPASFWTNHLALSLLLLYVAVSQMVGVVLFLLAIFHHLLLPSLTIPGLPLLPNQLTLAEEEAYLAKGSHITTPF